MNSAETSVRPVASTAPDVALFQQRMQQIWERDGFRVPDPDSLIRRIGALLVKEGPSSPACAAVLEESGVRQKWNRVFASDRASALADWIAPHLKPPVLDVLGGDFTVLRALIARGLAPSSCVGCERRAAYDTDWGELPFPVYDARDPVELPPVSYQTALVSTVLHHERDPELLLAELSAGPAERWVVIENALDEENSEDFHLFVDEFFNCCLNSFDVSCVSQHRTVDHWLTLLARYGRAWFAGQMKAVPGIPFPYQMFIVDRGDRGELSPGRT